MKLVVLKSEGINVNAHHTTKSSKPPTYSICTMHAIEAIVLTMHSDLVDSYECSVAVSAAAATKDGVSTHRVHPSLLQGINASLPFHVPAKSH